MTDLTRLTLSDAVDGLKAKTFSSQEITQAFLTQIDTSNETLNAYVVVTADKAMQMAKASDAKLAKGQGGKLEGAPLGIKDLFCTKGVRTTACSNILGEFTPTYESTVTQNLWDQGSVMLGKLNMDEFAMGSDNGTSRFGPPTNPWRRKNSNVKLTSGGSSGGSATAVAADLCLAATASDTGGSIRQPAAFTGIVGIKPTYGRASRYGMVAFASSLDQAGPLAKTVKDAALMLEVMCSGDKRDSTSLHLPVPEWTKSVGKSIKGMKIGVPKEYRADGMPEEIEKLWQQGIAWLKAAGAEIIDVSLPHTKYALPAYYIVAPAEASSNLARSAGSRSGARQSGDGSLTSTYETTRAERRILRRILSARPESADADSPGFRGSLQTVRRAADPRHAERGVRLWREG